MPVAAALPWILGAGRTARMMRPLWRLGKRMFHKYILNRTYVDTLICHDVGQKTPLNMADLHL